MDIFIITYDLIAPDKDYQSLYDAIESYKEYTHPLESIWFVRTSSSSRDIRDYLKSYLDSNDKLFVAKIDEWASRNLPDESTKWLKNK